MNGFSAHNIDHLSASSLNAYATQPASWCMERLLKVSVPVSAAAHRGTAIEAGVTIGLLYPDYDIEKCQGIATQKFNELTALSGDPKRQQEADAVAPSVEIALAELRQYGFPHGVQERIEKPLGDDLPPLIGFIDFRFGPTVVDLKTQLRLSSDISTPHARQVAGYVAGTNHEGRVCYVTPKKAGVYRLEDVEQRFNELRQIAIRLERFLAISNDPHELAGLLVPDTTHYFWSNPIAEAHRKEVYGF